MKKGLSGAVNTLDQAAVLISEYQTIGLTLLVERQHKPQGPQLIEAQLGRTAALWPQSLYRSRPVYLGVKNRSIDQRNFDRVHTLSIRQLARLYASVDGVNL